MVRGDVAAFGRELAWRFAEALDGGLIGAYFVGSVALGGYVAGESDVDIVSVSEHQLPVGVKPRIADAVLESAAACPTRGLEFTLYRRDVGGAPPRRADFEVDLVGWAFGSRGGPRPPCCSYRLSGTTRGSVSNWAGRSTLSLTRPPVAQRPPVREEETFAAPIVFDRSTLHPPRPRWLGGSRSRPQPRTWRADGVREIEAHEGRARFVAADLNDPAAVRARTRDLRL